MIRRAGIKPMVSEIDALFTPPLVNREIVTAISISLAACARQAPGMVDLRTIVAL